MAGRQRHHADLVCVFAAGLSCKPSIHGVMGSVWHCRCAEVVWCSNNTVALNIGGQGTAFEFKRERWTGKLEVNASQDSARSYCRDTF